MLENPHHWVLSERVLLWFDPELVKLFGFVLGIVYHVQ
jgi:hypothetical protein